MPYLLLAVFTVGYLLIIAEQFLRISKSATALLTGVALWTVYILMSPSDEGVVAGLVEHIGAFSGILFFLMAAMTIVELIDLHDGFAIVTNRISGSSKRLLLCILAFVTFFLSAVLDNLTTTIVMSSVAAKLIRDRADRLYFVGLIVIAANAGGAWSPIGDVTTTMLWIGGQVTGPGIVSRTFLPSLICMAVPLLWLFFRMKGSVRKPDPVPRKNGLRNFERYLVFFTGLGVLVSVPFFKALTHLPPYMGALFGLALLWVLTEFLHGHKNGEDREALSPAAALSRIDLPNILFFLGILLAISCLESSGILARCAQWLQAHIGNRTLVVFLAGLVSSAVDNVPLAAASMGMYPLSQFPPDHHLWTFLSYCIGTGGSILIIGSAAGVVAMGMEEIRFFWYLKRIAPLALAGYLAGAAWYLIAWAI